MIVVAARHRFTFRMKTTDGVGNVLDWSPETDFNNTDLL